MHLRPTLLLLLLGGSAQPTLANEPDSGSGVQFGAQVGLLDFDIDDTTFRPWTATIQAAWRDDNGLGLLTTVGTGVRDDESRRTELELDLLASGYLTWSALGELEPVTLTLGAGYAHLSTDSRGTDSSFPGQQDWNGPALLVRLEERLTSVPRLTLHFSYEHVYLDDPLSVSHFALGGSYAF